MSCIVTGLQIGGGGGGGGGGVTTDIHISHKHTTCNINQFCMKVVSPYNHSLTQSYIQIQCANN